MTAAWKCTCMPEEVRLKREGRRARDKALDSDLLSALKVLVGDMSIEEWRVRQEELKEKYRY